MICYESLHYAAYNNHTSIILLKIHARSSKASKLSNRYLNLIEDITVRSIIKFITLELNYTRERATVGIIYQHNLEYYCFIFVYCASKCF